MSRAPACGAVAVGKHFAGSRRGRGPRGHLPRPPCLRASALAGCRCPGPWGHCRCSRVGVLHRGAVGVLCWRSGHEQRLVRGRALVPREVCGLVLLRCVVARWGRLGPWFRPRGWFGLWLVVGAEVVCGVWVFRGWCRWGGGWCGARMVRCCSCVDGLRCPMSLVSASLCVAMSRPGPSGEACVGRGGECGLVRWRRVMCWLLH